MMLSKKKIVAVTIPKTEETNKTIFEQNNKKKRNLKVWGLRGKIHVRKFLNCYEKKLMSGLFFYCANCTKHLRTRPQDLASKN